jgi:ribose transport system substrate-binding protein
LGRSQDSTAIAGHAATRAARAEMLRSDTCLIGSVGFFPEKYGEQIIPLVLKVLEGEAVPPTAHVQHYFIDAENQATFYCQS